MQTKEKIVLKIQKLPHCAGMPEYKTKGAAGMDLVASNDEDITLKPLERFLVPTGIKIELPENYEAQIRPRSGLSIILATKHKTGRKAVFHIGIRRITFAAVNLSVVTSTPTRSNFSKNRPF